MRNLAQRVKNTEFGIKRTNIKKNNRTKGKTNNIKQIVFRHISNNIKEYTIVSIFFLIGVILGVIVINNSDVESQNNIQGYIQTFINSLKSNEYKIDIQGLLQSSIISNVKLALLIWFVGSTVIGMPLIYGIIAFRGYCLGYTIAAIMATLGSRSGITFALASLLLQNLLIIPGIFALSISGIRLYKAIMQDRRKENIKLEIYKHSIFSLGILIILVLAAVVETYASGNLIMLTVKYI